MTVFKNAPVLKTKGAKRSRNRPRDEVELAGLERAVAIRVVLDRLKELALEADAEVKAAAARHFVEEGCAQKDRPSSFVGVEGIAAAMMALRVRSVTSGLSDEDVAKLEAVGIPYDTVEEVAATYVINPTHARNARLMAKIEAAIQRVPGVPDDLFLRQVGKSRRVVQQDAMARIFELPPRKAAALLKIMGTISITPTVDDRALPLYLRMVEDILTKETVVEKPLSTKKKASAEKRKVATA